MQECIDCQYKPVFQLGVLKLPKLQVSYTENKATYAYTHTHICTYTCMHTHTYIHNTLAMLRITVLHYTAIQYITR